MLEERNEIQINERTQECIDKISRFLNNIVCGLNEFEKWNEKLNSENGKIVLDGEKNSTMSFKYLGNPSIIIENIDNDLYHVSYKVEDAGKNFDVKFTFDKYLGVKENTEGFKEILSEYAAYKNDSELMENMWESLYKFDYEPKE